MLSAIETADIFRGAYLLCCGGRVRETRLVAGQVRFVIEGEAVAACDEKYRLGTALVNPLMLRETLNLLRDLIFKRLRPETEKRRSSHGAHPDRRDRAAQANG